MSEEAVTSEEMDVQDLQDLAEEAQAVRQGMLISTASMLAIGLLQRPEITNGKVAIDQAIDLAQYLIDKVTSK